MSLVPRGAPQEQAELEMQGVEQPIPVVFPLVGEWMAPATPARSIPSHGTDMLGQRYAYDFVHASDIELAKGFWTGMRYWFGGGIDLKLSHGMRAPILSPIGGGRGSEGRLAGAPARHASGCLERPDR